MSNCATEKSPTALVVYTEGGHVFTEDVRRRTSEEVEVIHRMIRDVMEGDAVSFGFKLDGRNVRILASKIVAMTLASGE